LTSLVGDEWPHVPSRHVGPFFVLGVMARRCTQGRGQHRAQV